MPHKNLSISENRACSRIMRGRTGSRWSRVHAMASPSRSRPIMVPLFVKPFGHGAEVAPPSQRSVEINAIAPVGNQPENLFQQDWGVIGQFAHFFRSPACTDWKKIGIKIRIGFRDKPHTAPVPRARYRFHGR